MSRNFRALSHRSNVVCLVQCLVSCLCWLCTYSGVSVSRGRDQECIIKPSPKETSLSCCHLSLRYWSMVRRSLQLEPAAGCLESEPLGYTDSDYLSHRGTNHPNPRLGGVRSESMQRAWSPDSVPTLPIPPGGKNTSLRSSPLKMDDTTGRRKHCALTTKRPHSVWCVQENSPRPTRANSRKHHIDRRSFFGARLGSLWLFLHELSYLTS